MIIRPQEEESLPTSRPRPRYEIRVTSAPGAGAAISEAEAEGAARLVLEKERVPKASVSITFVTAARMRALNRRALGRDRATDVIAFPLRHQDRIVGDVYVCPSVARRSAGSERVKRREEEARLVIHGTLHVLGYDHPPGKDRLSSPMWHLQERYVRRLAESARR